MNKVRKNRIKKVINTLNDCHSELNDILYDENYAMNNTPENLQGGKNYLYSEECSEKLEDAVSDLGEIVNTLEEI